MQYHNKAPTKTAPTALPIPIPTSARLFNPGPEGIGRFGELVTSTDAALDVVGRLEELRLPIGDSEAGEIIGELVGAVVINTVISWPPLFVVRNSELVRTGVEALVAAELGAAVDEREGKGPSVASAQYME